MEPIVLIGLVAVCYGGYESLMDLWGDVMSALLPRRSARESRIRARGERPLQAPVKKMAGLYV